MPSIAICKRLDRLSVVAMSKAILRNGENYWGYISEILILAVAEKAAFPNHGRRSGRVFLVGEM